MDKLAKASGAADTKVLGSIIIFVTDVTGITSNNNHSSGSRL